MGFRDRFYTPKTAKAILSWRILLGAGVAAALIATGVGIPIGIAAGAAAYAGSVAAAMPKPAKRERIDPFTVQEPWRQLVQGAQRAETKLHEIVRAASDGPVKARMQSIVDKLEHGLDEMWQIAKRGHEIDGAVHRLDPTALRSKLGTLQQQTDGSDDLTQAIESVENQPSSTERLKQQSDEAAASLRLTQARLDELVARAAEVSVGVGDTDAYEHDVEDLVIELEGLRQAVAETRTA